MRSIVQHYILISTNSSLRVGEQLQLKWNDVKIEKLKNSDGEEVKLACTVLLPPHHYFLAFQS